jgi:hypothetical protein
MADVGAHPRRTDGYRSIDFTLLSVREIVPPR